MDTNVKLIILFSMFFSDSVLAAPLFKNINSYKTNLGFQTYYSKAPQKKLKIAVLDKGFAGYETEVGKTLPAGTQYIAGPVAAPVDIKVEHGLKMAQILTALLTNDLKVQELIPELYLYNVFGYSNFKAAIDDLISKQMDVVLYSEVWEYGGNNDGQGFINAEVNRATASGAIWVNAAGNYQTTTYNAKITTGNENWVNLPDENQALKFYCKQKDKKQKCQIKVVLTWNDFKNDVNQGTSKDLDMALADDLMNIVQSSALQQSSDVNESRPGFSKYSREIIAAEIPVGTYFLRVKNRSANFTDADELRITVDGSGIEMPRHAKDETLLNPADNASVITVGAFDSDRSSQSLSLGKPDILAPSSLLLADGSEVRGSSNSAAIVAAGVALLKGLNPAYSSSDILQSLQQQNDNSNQGEKVGFSLSQLGFWFTGPNCFVQANVSAQQTAHYPLEEIYSRGGVFVQTSIGVKIMVPFDPISMVEGGHRRIANDMVTITPLGMALYTRFGPKPYESVEVFQRPIEAGLCNSVANNQPPVKAKRFRLPPY
jgi:hypothetical protein